MRALVLLLPLALAGCTPFKSKTHAFFCIGACIHAEQAVEKEKGEAPKDPAPVSDEKVTE